MSFFSSRVGLSACGTILLSLSERFTDTLGSSYCKGGLIPRFLTSLDLRHVSEPLSGTSLLDEPVFPVGETSVIYAGGGVISLTVRVVSEAGSLLDSSFDFVCSLTVWCGISTQVLFCLDKR